MFNGKQVTAIGERDGVSGTAIATCPKAAGAPVAYVGTECSVWTAAGAMDLSTQDIIKRLADEHGRTPCSSCSTPRTRKARESRAETVCLVIRVGQHHWRRSSWASPCTTSSKRRRATPFPQRCGTSRSD
jgi:hypothetical protein